MTTEMGSRRPRGGGRWRSAGRLALLGALVSLAGAGCSGLEQIDSWPIVYTEPETERLPGRVEFLGPLGEVQWKDSVVQSSFRPLFSTRKYRDVPLDTRPQFKVPYFAPPATLGTAGREVPARSEPGKGRSARQVLVLYPLYSRHSCEPMSRTFLFPFYYNVRGQTEDGERWHHWFVLPYLGGWSDKRGSYSAVFPFWGALKGLLLQDEIRFVMFPLYFYTRRGERESYHWLWPFYTRTKGEGHDSWFVLPFVGRMKRGDEPAKWYFLWPFRGYTVSAKPGERASTGSVFFPFYGWQEEGNVRRVNVMWPAYSYAHNRATGRTDYVAPWPIVRYGYGPDYERLSVWPFYSSVREGQVRRWYVMWPFWRREERETEFSRTSGTSAMLFYRSIYTERDVAAGGVRTSADVMLWPFWHYLRDEEGNSYSVALTLRPGPDPEGIDRFYSWIWRLFEAESRVYGVGPTREVWRSTRAMWGAYRHDRDERGSFLRVFPLFSMRRAEGELRSLEVLMGLFGFVDRPHGRTYRVLFVPWSVERRGGR